MKKHLLFLSIIFILVPLSSCSPTTTSTPLALVTPVITTSPTLTLSPTYTSSPTITLSPTPTVSPTIFNSGDIDLYDNFNSRLYNLSFNDELWLVGGRASDSLGQMEGVFSIFKQGGTQDCPGVMAKKYDGFMPDSPFYYQADLKINPLYDKGPVQMWIQARAPDKVFSAMCGFEHTGRRALFVSCWNRWEEGDNFTEQYTTPWLLDVKLDEWHTFRIDYDVSATIFTYFIDNQNVGFYQVLDSEVLKNALFQFNFGVCAPIDAYTRGYFDNIRIGFKK